MRFLRSLTRKPSHLPTRLPKRVADAAPATPSEGHTDWKSPTVAGIYQEYPPLVPWQNLSNVLEQDGAATVTVEDQSGIGCYWTVSNAMLMIASIMVGDQHSQYDDIPQDMFDFLVWGGVNDNWFGETTPQRDIHGSDIKATGFGLVFGAYSGDLDISTSLLKVSGFDFSEVPSDALVVGIEARATLKQMISSSTSQVSVDSLEMRVWWRTLG